MLQHCLGAPYFYGTPTSQVKAGGRGHFPQASSPEVLGQEHWPPGRDLRLPGVSPGATSCGPVTRLPMASSHTSRGHMYRAATKGAHSGPTEVT